jgi:hypothetical protein
MAAGIDEDQESRVMKVPLEALLRRISRMAERAFSKQGNIDMFWLVERADGKQTTLETPIIETSEYRRDLDHALREMFREEGVVRYAMALEAWTAPFDDDPRAPIERPDRKEAVVLEASDGSECLTGLREVIRPGGAGKPYLGKLEIGELSVGRFTNLLDANEKTVH